MLMLLSVAGHGKILVHWCSACRVFSVQVQGTLIVVIFLDKAMCGRHNLKETVKCKGFYIVMYM